jgi:hypothetical protein
LTSRRPSLDQGFSDPEEEHLVGSCLAVPLDHCVDEVLGDYTDLEPPVAFLEDVDLFPWQELPALMERIVAARSRPEVHGPRRHPDPLRGGFEINALARIRLRLLTA